MATTTATIAIPRKDVPDEFDITVVRSYGHPKYVIGRLVANVDHYHEHGDTVASGNLLTARQVHLHHATEYLYLVYPDRCLIRVLDREFELVGDHDLSEDC